MHRSGRRIPVLAALTAVAAATLLATPAVAAAAPPTSAIDVSQATVRAGETFQVTQQLYNPTDFTVTAAKASLYGKEKAITSLVDLVSCTGTIVPCAPYFSSFRGPVGDLAAGESRTVVFTFRVKDGVEPGDFTLQHQFVGDNYAFDTYDGPVVTIAPPNEADVKVALTATPRFGAVARVDYVITVSNAGPATATGIRLAATYPANRQLTAATGCTRVGTTRTLACTFASLAAGSTATAKFSTEGGLFAFGAFTTSVQRQSSAPEDPSAANDSASAKCTAYSGFYVHC